MSDNVVEKRRSFVEQAGAAGIASAAVIAAAAVNSAVGMRQLSAPDDQKSFVYKDGGGAGRVGQVDEYGLPLVYDKDLIQLYWAKQGSALTQRWTEFLGYSVPFLTRVIAIVVAGGTEDLSKNGASLAKDARVIFEKLGPTYIKMGQMMSVRPDVLPQSALNELKILQDSVQPFDTPTAISMIEKELGGPLGMFFSEISDEPVAAASLAQVYKAKLINSDQFVAVKVQRPRILEVVSKDLYVLRRAAEVYQGLMDRFAPQQRTNYVALLNEWAVGFYTELDFKNEAANQQRLKELMTAEGVTGMYVPEVFHDLCTRRVMVSEWVDGKKLSDLESAELATLIPDAQEAFLTQLLQVGFFHSDPHPGNMLRMDVPRGDARIALLDFGLVASIKQSDMDTMVSAIIHLANNDYTSLVDDFIQLEILPKDCDRPKIIPLMDKALTPYVKGGGAQSYEEELKKIYGMDGSMSGTAGGFSAMTQDALTVLNDIPFSIPPYFALLARAIVTLEGVALTANPKYALILESYPFISRKLLKEDRPEIQRALQEVLYSRGGSGLQATRLSVLLNSALGIVAKSSGAMVDFDTIPEDGVSLTQSLKYLLGPSAASLRRLLIDEAVTAGDILIRQASRKAYSQILPRLPRPPFLGRFLPSPEDLRVPFFIPKQRLLASSLTAAPVAPIDLAAFTTSRPDFVKLAQSASPVFLTAKQLLDGAAPKLSREEELYAISLTDLAVQTLGADAGVVVNGNALLDPRAASRFLLSIASSGQLPGLGAILTSAQLRGISDRLRPLLGGTDAVPTGKGEGLTELVSGLGGLTAEEEVILQETSNSILLKIADKFIGRMQTLL
ncbi:ABC1 family-domain-containing protein [Ochromonadaceae sp. CCMP2298]|nr:ABC1 family-domain-containing protein [Ochromonadaceae sp. CCMP2298]KAJ1443792.1 ABC1 family-domain-containing protein [Ochromonadaceae sp. CCMP2298]